MDRRTFLKGSLVGVGMAAGIGGQAAGAQEAARPKAQLRLGAQVWLVPGKNLGEQVANLQKWGAAGVEFSPEVLKPARLKEIQQVLKDSPIKPTAICGAEGPFIVPDEAQRRRAVENAKRLLDAGGELGCTGVIMVPATNKVQGQLHNPEAYKVLVDLLREMGEHAVKARCRMILEPLNRTEAWYMRMVAEAANVCREISSPGVAAMGDFYHMAMEEVSDMGAFISGGSYLHHVHIASRTRSRVLPHQENSDYRNGFRGLKMIGYQDFVSLECHIRQGDPAEEIPKTFRYLEKQWAEA